MVANFKKHQKRKNLGGIFATAGLVCIAAFIVLLVVADARVYKKKQQLNLQIEKLKSRIENLEKEKISLKESIDMVDNQDYIEKVAREELNLKQPGETVVSFVEEEKQPSDEADKKESILNAWLGWLSGVFKK